MMDYLENGNIVNSVNFPNCSLGEKDEAARISIINSNVSGMLSKITGELGDVGINVENLINKSKGDYAYTLRSGGAPAPSYRAALERGQQLHALET